jgi:hypothetical protein
MTHTPCGDVSEMKVRVREPTVEGKQPFVAAHDVGATGEEHNAPSVPHLLRRRRALQLSRTATLPKSLPAM